MRGSCKTKRYLMEISWFLKYFQVQFKNKPQCLFHYLYKKKWANHFSLIALEWWSQTDNFLYYKIHSLYSEGNFILLQFLFNPLVLLLCYNIKMKWIMLLSDTAPMEYKVQCKSFYKKKWIYFLIPPQNVFVLQFKFTVS